MNVVCPSWLDGLLWKMAVSGGRGAATESVAALVSSSLLPASSVKESLTLMVLPSSESTSVYVELVAPSISASLLVSHW